MSRRSRPLSCRRAAPATVIATRAWVVWFGALLLTLSGCGREPDALPPLPAANVARCGDEHVSARSLEAAAVARHAAPRQVLPLLLADACLAAGARRRGLPRDPAGSVEQRALQARLVLEELKRAPAVTAPISDEETAGVRAERWAELDHDRATKVVHAVVKFPKEGPRDLARLRQRAQAILLAVDGATDEADFRRRAAAAASGEPDVTIETLEPVLPDGRVLGEGEIRYDVAFAAAASELRAPGQQSGLVETPFGLHVLHALASVPAVHVEPERLRTLVAPEIRARRARGELERLLVTLRRDHPTLVSREAEALLARSAPNREGPSP